jgi:hypothetical protein
MTVDAAGNTYIGGSVASSSTDIGFSVVKLDPAGAVVWRHTYSGSRGGVLGQVNAVAIDTTGDVYAAGSLSDTTGFGQVSSALLIKLAPDGTEQWAQRQTGDGAFGYSKIAVDPSGAVYATGTTTGGSAGSDWLTQRYGPDGALQWTSRFSGPGTADDSVSDIALAPGGNVVVAGEAKNNGDGITNDAEVVTYDPGGQTVWQRSFTKTNASDEAVRDIGIDAGGRITVTGSTAVNASPEFGIPTPLTLRYDASGTLLQTAAVGGGAVAIDKAGNAFLAGAFTGPGTDGASTVSKYDAAGNQVWLTPLTFSSSDFLFVAGIAVDSQGEPTVVGSVTNTTNLNQDYLTIRYSADGHELWRHRFNGTANGTDTVSAVAVDGQDAALVTGTSLGSAREDIVTLKFPAGVTPAGGTPPAAPSRLTATAQSRSQVRLAWQDNASDETGYRIERCGGAGCTTFTEIATVGPNVTAFSDSGLSRDTSFTYRVRAVNSDGASPFSNTATARTRS